MSKKFGSGLVVSSRRAPTPGGVDMGDKSLHAEILGLTDPWGVKEVESRPRDGEVHV
jgi:hypothetical protein